MPLLADNALLRDGAGLRVLLTSARMTSADIWPGHYRPLLMLTYWFQYQCIGMTPWAYRLVDLALHLGVGVLLYRLGRRLVSRHDAERATLVAAIAAGVWLVHPIHAIAVELVLKRNTSLCVLLMLFALGAFLRGRELGALVLGAAALLVKEDALVLPALAALVAAYDTGRVPWRRVAPLAVFPLGVAIWALLRHHAGGAALAYACAQPLAVARYLAMLVAPRTIAAAYDLEPGLTPLRLVGLAAVVAVLALAWLARRRSPHVAFTVAWAALALVPSSSIIPIAPAMDEVRVYLAFMPLFVLVAAGLARQRLAIPLTAALLLALAGLTAEAAHRWTDPARMWAHAVAHNPTSKIGNRGLCEARPDPEQCRRAVALWLDDAYSRYDLVAALVGAHDIAGARAEAERAAATLPAAPMSWLAVGNVAWYTDDAVTARRAYARVLALDPGNAMARRQLADLDGKR